MSDMVLVCGSRLDNNFDGTLRAWELLKRRLGDLPAGTLVLTGGASGVDHIANKVAGNLGLPRRVMRADWTTHGKRAGIVRNLAMLDEKPRRVLAFWDGKSPGTKHTIGEARKRGIPTEVVLLPNPDPRPGQQSEEASR